MQDSVHSEVAHGWKDSIASRLAVDMVNHTGTDINGSDTTNRAATEARPASCSPNFPDSRAVSARLTDTKTMTTKGMVHTKWWYQEKGETKQVLRPVSAKAAERLPRRYAVRSAKQVRAKTTMTASSHQMPPSIPSSRNISERSDFAPGLACSPTREELNMASVQKSIASGTKRKPSTTVTKKVMTAPRAAHQRFSKSKASPI